MDNTYRDGSKCIDTIAASESILSFVEGCRLHEINEILNTDHCGYVVDINLKEYFDQEFSSWDQINKSLLDPEKRSHREKFEELIEKTLDSMDIEGNLVKLIKGSSLKQQLEMIDKDITYALNKVRKKIKGSQRGIPYLKEKV